MSETPSSSPSTSNEPGRDEFSPEAALCLLGSLSGEHTIELSQMSRGGEPIPGAPHISVWTDEPNPSNGDPLATGMSVLSKSTKDDDYPPYIVNVDAPHHMHFDYSEAAIPDGLAAAEGDDESRLWFGRFDTLEEGLEALVAAAEELAAVPRTA